VQSDQATECYACDTFGVFGTALQGKIGVFHSSYVNGAENPKHVVRAPLQEAAEAGGWFRKAVGGWRWLALAVGRCPRVEISWAWALQSFWRHALTPACKFCIENHTRDTQGGARMAATPAAELAPVPVEDLARRDASRGDAQAFGRVREPGAA
jgi:hypothetical protein